MKVRRGRDQAVVAEDMAIASKENPYPQPTYHTIPSIRLWPRIITRLFLQVALPLDQKGLENEDDEVPIFKSSKHQWKKEKRKRLRSHVGMSFPEEKTTSRQEPIGASHWGLDPELE
ncbi:hypothetical protein NC652_034772 [Populus alba x Populus x berolinensis]|nr:hypothetical protein NC652_034772 [Populus alba x Populus x berolinensis]